MNHADPVAQAEIDRLTVERDELREQVEHAKIMRTVAENSADSIAEHALEVTYAREAVVAKLMRRDTQLREIRRGLRSLDLEMKNLEVVCRRIEEIVDQILE